MSSKGIGHRSSAFTPAFRGLRGRFVSNRLDIDELNRQAREKRFNVALIKLQDLDPEGWERWFDDDANIPPQVEHMGIYADLIEARIAELEAAR